MEVPCAVKKKAGKLSLTGELVQWTSNDRSVPSETVPLADIQGMQATPPTAAKLRIKLTGKEGKTLMLEFGVVTDLEKARNELQVAIKARRDSSSQAPSAEPEVAKEPSVQPKSAAPKSKKGFSLDPKKLVQNLELQRLVLRQDPDLMRTFQQVVISSNSLTNEQFWSLRIHLLVTASQQQAQMRGSYNVLSTIKPMTSSDNRVNINLTRETITDLFDQYPVVRKAYNDNVPGLSEGAFWQRFFMSRLFLVLKGERVSQNHPIDHVLDKYIDVLNDLQNRQRAKRAKEDSEHPAPLFMNVEANAENNPETYGNNVLTTSGQGTRGLIRSMNGLSHRLLLSKRKEREAYAEPNNLDEELRLNDLSSKKRADERVTLHLYAERAEQNTSQIFETHETVKKMAGLVPDRMSLEDVGSDFEGLKTAQLTISALTPHSQTTDVTEGEVDVSDELQLTQTTTLEFLRQFWHAYSTDRDQAASLREFLVKSVDRIQAVQRREMIAPLSQALTQALNMPL